LAIAVTGVTSWLVLRAASIAGGFISGTMLRVLERVMGLLLSAVAVELLVGGLADLLPLGRS
jgi:small neutral amino acid transporter SnatA (MarC family)